MSGGAVELARAWLSQSWMGKSQLLALRGMDPVDDLARGVIVLAEENAKMREVLGWPNNGGGLGSDNHRRIREVLALSPAKERE